MSLLQWNVYYVRILYLFHILLATFKSKYFLSSNSTITSVFVVLFSFIVLLNPCCDERRDGLKSIAWAQGKSERRSSRDFTKAQAIFPSSSRLESQYRHIHLPNNGSNTALAYAAVAAVAFNIDADVPLELFFPLEEIIAAMLTHRHWNSHSHSH